MKTYSSVSNGESRLCSVDCELVVVLLKHVVLDFGLVGFAIFVPVSNASFVIEFRAT